MESSSKLAVVIMAAGKGTRLKSRRPKVLHEIGGKPLLAHVIAAAGSVAPPEDIYVVVGHQADRVKAAVEASGVGFVEQSQQRGTGHAIQCARQAIAPYENVLVLSGDVPLIRPRTIEALWDFHRSQQAAMTILAAYAGQPEGYGRIVRKSSGTPEARSSPEVEAIVEQKALAAAQQEIHEVNSGIYVFRTAPLLARLGQLSDGNANNEIILTDMAGLLREAGERVVAIQAAETTEEVLGANTIAELVALDAALRASTARRLMASGVTIFRPETCVIDADVEVDPDTVIEPFVQLLGRTRVGAECLVRSYSVVENSILGNEVLLRQGCIVSGSNIGDRAKIGPYAHLRPGSDIGSEAHIGNFVETKKVKLGAGTKANHLTYLGDAEIGEATNIGAGVITCNYDGVNKHLTKIGNGVFVGSDSTLVAPVTIEDGAYVGAGSCITRKVPQGSLAVGRARQIVKEGWAAARKAAARPSE